MDENLECGMYRIPERPEGTLEKRSDLRFEEIKAKNQEFLNINREKLRDYELFMAIGGALEVCREKKLGARNRQMAGSNHQERRLRRAA
ncbi:MAG: hypothetical protein LBE03_00465 [Candidatus Nomurabacteria bacterium]|jgi:hypothetical protein|nr:hypothetical protein [Candidatus Nomurabacteria bacterium]